jgi:succinate dehydrogenase / fumarate reductase cytochrome b subunit
MGIPASQVFAAAAASSADYFAWVQGFMASGIGIVLLIGWAFALYYHLCNGIRHLFWDAGIGLDLGPARLSGMAAAAAAAALTVLSAVVALAPAGAPA